MRYNCVPPLPLLCGYYNYLMIATDKLTPQDQAPHRGHSQRSQNFSFTLRTTKLACYLMNFIFADKPGIVSNEAQLGKERGTLKMQDTRTDSTLIAEADKV